MRKTTRLPSERTGPRRGTTLSPSRQEDRVMPPIDPLLRTPLLNGPPGTVDLARIEAAVREVLLAVGEDPDREGLQETPARVARMYAEMFCGLHTDPRIHLQK